MNNELRDKIAEICRKGNAGIAETRVVDALYQLVVESQVEIWKDLSKNASNLSNSGTANQSLQSMANRKVRELQSQLSSIGESK